MGAVCLVLPRADLQVNAAVAGLIWSKLNHNILRFFLDNMATHLQTPLLELDLKKS